MFRKLARIVVVKNVRHHPNADALDLCNYDGWQVVTRRGEFKENQFAVAFEIDSWVPHTLAPFLSKGKEPRVFEEVLGERLKTVKLRGEISQGLLLPISILEKYNIYSFQENDDLTDILGIKKWERPEDWIPAMAKGSFPGFIEKTDQTRIQNLPNILEQYKNELFEETIKLDGSSMTMYYLTNNSSYKSSELEYQFGVCSRNLELKEDETNSFWKIAHKFNVLNKMISNYPNRSLAIQGELIGPSIQNNYEKVLKNEFYVFDIFDIETQKYLNPEERYEIVKNLGLNHVPILNKALNISQKFNSIQEMLKNAEGEGMNKGVKREGKVYKHLNSDFSFKTISNSYLLKNS